MNDRLKSLVRDTSLDRLAAFTPQRKLNVSECAAGPGIRGHWMAVILISGEKLRITFKVQFSSQTAEAFSRASFQGAVDPTSAQAKDFVREYCNMTAGYVKNALDKSGIAVGLSLPLLSRGYDDIFFKVPKNSGVISDQWNLADEVNILFCSSVIEVFGDLILPDDLAVFNSSGEVEFF